MVVSLRNCGIITSQANSKAVCKAPKGRFYPADAGIVRTFYHNLGLSPLRLRRYLRFAQVNCGIINTAKLCLSPKKSFEDFILNFAVNPAKPDFLHHNAASPQDLQIWYTNRQ